ncbi:MAG: MFS transporter, partial [Bradyrhizobium guangdongense]
MRLVIALLIGSIGAVGMWAVVVVIPVVQTEFGATRGAVSLAFTLMMFGFGLGGVITGRITDRVGIVPAMAISIAFLGVSNVLAGLSTQLWQFVAVYFLIGLGTSATFAPLMAEASHWFERYRGLAVTIVASGNYVAGAMWPPIVNYGMETVGWRMTHIWIGIVCASLMAMLVLLLRAQMGNDQVRNHANAPPPRVDLNLSTNTLTVLLSIASISCCVAMAMPQVHIVAYCGDLGYGVARGAEMLSLMMACGIVSRIGSGFLADKVGGMRTLLIGSIAQGFALVFYLFFDGLTSLYLISAMFGLFQGGIVPA